MKERIIYAVLTVGKFGMNVIYYFQKKRPTEEKVSIISRQADEPSADILMIKEELKKKGVTVELSCMSASGGIRVKIKYLWYLLTKQMKIFATSKIIILDGYCVCASMLKHKEGLVIIQMWHALGAFKKFGYACLGTKEGRNEAVAKAMNMHQGYAYVFASHENAVEPLSKGYGCKKSLFKVYPLPRIDLLKSKEFMQQKREEILAEYPEFQNGNVILYAPTFRKGKDFSGEVKDLEDALKDCNLVIKMHPSERSQKQYDKFSSLEFLSVADVVITDYSSFLFEASYAAVPVIRYVPDEEEYNEERGFLLDTRSWPFTKCHTAKETALAIRDKKYDLVAEKVFANQFIRTPKGNTATEEIADFVTGLL